MFIFIVDIGAFFASFIFLRRYRTSLTLFFSMFYSAYIPVAYSLPIFRQVYYKHNHIESLLINTISLHSRGIAYIALPQIRHVWHSPLPVKITNTVDCVPTYWVGIYFFNILNHTKAIKKNTTQYTLHRAFISAQNLIFWRL